MVSKYLCAALAAGAVLQGELVRAREAPVYTKVNRDSEYGAPEAPASSYNAPAASYSAPAPAASYGAPAPSYGAPAPSYAAPSYGVAYEDDTKFPDITFIIVGILIVTGLALLFPTYVSLSTVRRKRSTADTADEGNKDCRTPPQPATPPLCLAQLSKHFSRVFIPQIHSSFFLSFFLLLVGKK